MGYVSEVLKGVNGIQWYYIIGIAIFIILFVIIVYKTIRTPKSELNKYKNSILDEDTEDADNQINEKNK
ncbi:hypothetical protein SAMN06265379_103240 [Saccharicrinis carchari]|uniref:Cbb3-type cytochrome oxidase component FixQ n=1 Tax=Saccharicrinis carchari TaxID=1168039 RepID=A0A521CKL6_SACCC|nr:hypothetical protein [Saccharicrinis carchari]SMO59974.1 hypothetical protein SAMN06265379_103240 [Saccharicrinis carchari]